MPYLTRRTSSTQRYRPPLNVVFSTPPLSRRFTFKKKKSLSSAPSLSTSKFYTFFSEEDGGGDNSRKKSESEALLSPIRENEDEIFMVDEEEENSLLKEEKEYAENINFENYDDEGKSLFNRMDQADTSSINRNQNEITTSRDKQRSPDLFIGGDGGDRSNLAQSFCSHQIDTIDTEAVDFSEAFKHYDDVNDESMKEDLPTDFSQLIELEKREKLVSNNNDNDRDGQIICEFGILSVEPPPVDEENYVNHEIEMLSQHEENEILLIASQVISQLSPDRFIEGTGFCLPSRRQPGYEMNVNLHRAVERRRQQQLVNLQENASFSQQGFF